MIALTPRGAYFGPNPLSPHPVIIVDVAVQGAANRARSAVAQMAQFNAPWLEPIARQRPHEPTDDLIDYLLRWSLAALNYDFGHLSACGYQRLGADRYRVWLGHHVPQVSMAALDLAAAQARGMLEGNLDPAAISARMNALWDLCGDRHPDIVSGLLIETARVRGIPWQQALDLSKLWQIGWGARRDFFFYGAGIDERMISMQVSRHKHFGKAALRRLGFPTPEEVVITREDEIPAAIARIGFPCVVKPNDLGSGSGVSPGLTSEERVREGFALARSVSNEEILVERHVPGEDHRLMVIGGRFIGAFRREIPAVTGDGVRTVKALADAFNAGRVMPDRYSFVRLKRIKFDAFTQRHLAGQGLSPDSVLEAGRTVTLRGNANLATGGRPVEVTEHVHPMISTAAEVMARAMGLHVAGIDYITTDISRGWDEVPGAFIETNLTPSLDLMSQAGWDVIDVGNLVLPDREWRIPVHCVVVPDAMIADAESQLAGLAWPGDCGWASLGKAQIGSLALLITPSNAWSGVQTLLSHVDVERAWLLLASSDLQKRGFPVDRVDAVWNCDTGLPADWAGVLDAVSAAPVVNAEWPAVLAQLPPPR